MKDNMHYNDIPCLVDYETREDCIDLGAKKAEDGMIFVELGTYLGGTICRLAKQIQERNIKCQITAIDNWCCDNISRESLQWSNLNAHSEVLDKFLDNLKKVGVFDFINIMVSDTIGAANEFKDKSVNYLFMDASHGYGGVKAELEVWLPKMADRCLMFIHDWPADCIKQAVYDVCGRDNLEIVRGGSTAIIKNTL